MRTLILAPFAEAWLERLSKRVDVVYESWLETGRLYDPEALGQRLAAEDIAILIVEADFVFEETFAAAPGLRLVGTCRGALNQVDIASATAHGVPVVHAPGRNTNAVAEMTVALLLALFRRLPDAHRLVAGAGWRDPAFGYRHLRGREIAGATVGIVGFGRIGREVARKLMALDAHIMVYDPLVDGAEVRAQGGEPASLEEIAARADAVSLHVPDMPATRRMVDAAFLKRMRRDAYLINTGSGPAVDPDALVDALESGAIAGAALDVFDGHPLPLASRLLAAPNVILTPHIGGATRETIERHSRMMTEEIERLLDGRPLEHLVNPGYAAARAG